MRASFRAAFTSLSGITKPMAVVIGLLSGVTPLSAQTQPSSTTTSEQQISKVAADMQAWPRLQNLSPDQRRETVIFVLGNMLYGVFHEMGHAVISEMQLPVLGREEDA